MRLLCTWQPEGLLSESDDSCNDRRANFVRTLLHRPNKFWNRRLFDVFEFRSFATFSRQSGDLNEVANVSKQLSRTNDDPAIAKDRAINGRVDRFESIFTLDDPSVDLNFRWRSRAAATRVLLRKVERERKREAPGSPAFLRVIDTRKSYHRPVVIVRARLFTTYARKAAIGEWKSTVGLIGVVTGDIFICEDLSSIDQLGYRDSSSHRRFSIGFANRAERLGAIFKQLQRSIASPERSQAVKRACLIGGQRRLHNNTDKREKDRLLASETRANRKFEESAGISATLPLKNQRLRH